MHLSPSEKEDAEVVFLLDKLFSSHLLFHEMVQVKFTICSYDEATLN